MRGTLRVTAPVAFSRQQLVPAMTPFLHQHPQLELQLEVTDRLVSLASEGFDLAIRHCRREALPDTHVAWTLCQNHHADCCLPGVYPPLWRPGIPRCATPSPVSDLPARFAKPAVDV
ncbi:D-malate degradation protein R [Raoultella terrigena]|uniref:D-malate degradation protein R n=1 Tax=Raoultella terrigena TaxID=577 RepID=A0A4U9CXU0_RAOTE|nr:D-malate degradation protein R [Raoultella terrigena]